MSKQIKSRERVAEHGEVFTNEREVNDMLDLVKQETERIESRFLEPACGSGNFLDPILCRKLDVVAKLYKKKQTDYEKYSVLAVTSIYGVELMQDNVDECIERLYKVWFDTYKSDIKKEPADNVKEAIKFILKKNILCGDALTMSKADGTPIIFAQWDFVIDTKLKRKDYRLDELMKGQSQNQMAFDMLDWEEDPETGMSIPNAIKEYAPVDYWTVQEVTE